jgi:hypothetical protein
LVVGGLIEGDMPTDLLLSPLSGQRIAVFVAALAAWGAVSFYEASKRQD